MQGLRMKHRYVQINTDTGCRRQGRRGAKRGEVIENNI